MSDFKKCLIYSKKYNDTMALFGITSFCFATFLLIFYTFIVHEFNLMCYFPLFVLIYNIIPVKSSVINESKLGRYYYCVFRPAVISLFLLAIFTAFSVHLFLSKGYGTDFGQMTTEYILSLLSVVMISVGFSVGRTGRKHRNLLELAIISPAYVMYTLALFKREKFYDAVAGIISGDNMRIITGVLIVIFGICFIFMYSKMMYRKAR